MRLRIISIVAAWCMLVCGNYRGIAQPAQPLEPIVVKITDIHRETSPFRLDRREQGNVWLYFYFENKGKTEVDALLEEGLHNKRRVHILDGTNLVARCRIVGGAQLQKSGGEILKYGLILGFDSVADAERATKATSENWTDQLRRRVNDRRRGNFF